MTTTDPRPSEGLITFTDGLPGFERFREYVLVASPDLDPFTCMQGLDPSGPSFIAVDPHRVVDGYRGEVPPSERARLKAEADSQLLWLALVTVGDSGASVNLRAPLVINPDTMLGVQLVTIESPYALDHPLTGF